MAYEREAHIRESFDSKIHCTAQKPTREQNITESKFVSYCARPVRVHDFM